MFASRRRYLQARWWHAIHKPHMGDVSAPWLTFADGKTLDLCAWCGEDYPCVKARAASRRLGNRRVS